MLGNCLPKLNIDDFGLSVAMEQKVELKFYHKYQTDPLH